MPKLITERHSVESSKANKTYVVSKYDDGSWACSCPSWIFHKGTKVNCKHISEVLSKQQQLTLTITGISGEKEKKEGIKNELQI